jgi:poly(3-hydroxybutyrate) depolymerase
MLVGSAGAARAEARLLERTLVHQGAQRSYKLYVPSTAVAGRAPALVVALHGNGGQGRRR